MSKITVSQGIVLAIAKELNALALNQYPMLKGMAGVSAGYFGVT
jgi:hypothetical protein